MFLHILSVLADFFDLLYFSMNEPEVQFGILFTDGLDGFELAPYRGTDYLYGYRSSQLSRGHGERTDQRFIHQLIQRRGKRRIIGQDKTTIFYLLINRIYGFESSDMITPIENILARSNVSIFPSLFFSIEVV